ncbi:MAG: A/G-specific adenine glycosylase [Rhodobacteraceae bacterium]|nr:A/G-specific adenine glycosylase [Paracoccaceae bacterium]
MYSNYLDQPKSQVLLEWYDRSARVMPWRVSPTERLAGVKPDAYKVWLSEVMLQQTTVITVKGYFNRFILRWPTLTDLAKAKDADVMGEWAGLGYYARARNLLKCARILETEFDSIFPEEHSQLLKLPGIGPYTASAISAIAFDKAETVVDGNVERVMSRLFAIDQPLPHSKQDLITWAESLTPKKRPGDYAQAVMDLGATICTPKRPACGLCPWLKACKARRLGIASELPRKLIKKRKPIRNGVVYFVEREDGALLLETRPENGLLGGMLGWPGSEWEEKPTNATPFDADWTVLRGEVRHTFTHFHLRLTIRTAVVGMNVESDRGVFMPRGDFNPSNLPTVMRKVYDLVKSGAKNVTKTV